MDEMVFHETVLARVWLLSGTTGGQRTPFAVGVLGVDVLLTGLDYLVDAREVLPPPRLSFSTQLLQVEVWPWPPGEIIGQAIKPRLEA